jgi:hypothetical protein
MGQWGRIDKEPYSTIEKKNWSQEGADKAQIAVEAVGSFIPGVGQVIAAKDYANAIENKDTVGGVLAAAQFLPILGGTAKLGSTFMKPSEYALKMMRRGGITDKAMEKTIKRGSKAAFTANAVQTAKELAD